jgi:hypothetical protein
MASECVPAAAHDREERYFYLLIVMAVYLLTRFVVLFTSLQSIFDSEDLAMGVVAKEIIGGARLPLFDYQYLTYSGGTLVVGLLAVPFFLLFGPNYFALKMVPLLFSAATLAVLFLFAWKYFNKRMALIAAFLYIFSSSPWGAFTLFLGFHVESLLFTLLASYLVYGIIFNAEGGRLRYFLLGALAGFAVYFSYTFVITAVALVTIWLIHDPRLFYKREFVFLLMGTVLGFSPWIFYNLGCDFKGLTDVLPVYSHGVSQSGGNWKMLSANFLQSLWFSPLFSLKFIGERCSSAYAHAYTALFWSSALCILYGFRRSWKKLAYSRELLIIAFPVSVVLFAVFYGTQSQGGGVESRYLVGIYPFAFLAVAFVTARIVAQVRLARFSVAGISAAVFLAAAALYTLHIDYSDLGWGFRQPGYSYFYLAETINYKYPDNFYKILDTITRLPAPQKYEVLTTRLTFDLGDQLVPVDFSEYVRLTQRIDLKYKPYFYKLLVNGLFYNSKLTFEEIVARVAAFSRQAGEQYRPAMYEGIGALAVKRYPDEPARCRDLGLAVAGEFLPAYYRGLSSSLYTDDIPVYLARCKNILTELGAGEKPYFLDGMGEVLARFAVDTFIAGLRYGNKGLDELYAFIWSLDEPSKAYLLTGAGKGIAYFYDGNTEKDVYRFVNRLSGVDRAVVLKSK